MRTAICDDEELFVKTFSEILKKQCGITDVYGYINPKSLLSDIESGHTFDIVFMDIKLSENGKNGIDYASDICRILPKVQIIFITGYNQYSQDIFQKEINLCGYLLKKIDVDRLAYLICKASDAIKSLNENCLAIENKKTTYAVPHRHIIFIESKGHNIIVHTRDEEIITYGKLDELEVSLPNFFERCHKSYLINLNDIERIEGYKVILTNSISIPISRSRYQYTYQRFLDYVKSLM